ncbi:MAG: hypothetical protein JHD16_00880 [Solirubrobacteraceae bacterium]|nr:hypothetical protein [Solirubrobacteraceae bacterium]
MHGEPFDGQDSARSDRLLQDTRRQLGQRLAGDRLLTPDGVDKALRVLAEELADGRWQDAVAAECRGAYLAGQFSAVECAFAALSAPSAPQHDQGWRTSEDRLQQIMWELLRGIPDHERWATDGWNLDDDDDGESCVPAVAAARHQILSRLAKRRVESHRDDESDARTVEAIRRTGRLATWSAECSLDDFVRYAKERLPVAQHPRLARWAEDKLLGLDQSEVARRHGIGHASLRQEQTRFRRLLEPILRDWLSDREAAPSAVRSAVAPTRSGGGSSRGSHATPRRGMPLRAAGRR